MKRFLRIIVALLVSLVCFSVSASAEGNIDTYSDEFGFDEAFSALDGSAVAILDELGINEITFDSIFDISFEKVFNSVLDVFSNSISEPLTFLLISCAVAALTAGASSLIENSQLAQYVGTCFFALLCAVPAAKCTTAAISAISCVAKFSATFAGAFCALISSSGGFNSSLGFATASAVLNVIFTFLCEGFAQSVLNLMCGFSFLSCFNINAFSEKVSGLVKRGAVFLLGIFGAVFTGILSLKGVLADSADSLASRSIRFLVGESIPIVGGVVSQSYSALFSSLKLIKSTAGVFGIFAVALTVMPSLVSLGAWILSFSVCEVLCDSLGCEKIVTVTRILKDAFTIAAALLVFCALVFTVSVGVILKGGA